MVKTTPVTSPQDIDALAELASEIWNEYFPPIIGQAQVDYMLGKFQSALAIARQIREDGYAYYLVVDEDECAAGGVSELWLTVNKDNLDSIAFYERLGFVLDRPLHTDIGHGFVMDDHRMVKTIMGVV